MRKFMPNLWRIVNGVITGDKEVQLSDDLRVGGEITVGDTAANDTNRDIQVVNATLPMVEMCDSKGGTRKYFAAYLDPVANTGIIEARDSGSATPINIKGSELQCNSAVQPFRKIIEIGDWNMVASSQIAVLHGLSLSNIIGGHALIRNDADTVRSTVCGPRDTGFSGYLAGLRFDSDEAIIYREASSLFDHTDYNATSYNRGWIIIDHF